MTTKTLNGKEILVVEVPKGAIFCPITGEVYCKIIHWNWLPSGWISFGKNGLKRKLPFGQWSILGGAKDITEEQASELVDSYDRAYGHSLESFQSWLKAEGIKETDLLLIKNS